MLSHWSAVVILGDKPLVCHMSLLTSDTKRHLTKPFHGLVQDLSICAGFEVCTWFHGSSVGLQQGRNGQEEDYSGEVIPQFGH